jgi:hypothetical protein
VDSEVRALLLSHFVHEHVHLVYTNPVSRVATWVENRFMEVNDELLVKYYLTTYPRTTVTVPENLKLRMWDELSRYDAFCPIAYSWRHAVFGE